MPQIDLDLLASQQTLLILTGYINFDLHLNKYRHSDHFTLLQRGIEGDFLIRPGFIANL